MQIHVCGFDHKAPLMLREVLKRLLDLGPHLKEGTTAEAAVPSALGAASIASLQHGVARHLSRNLFLAAVGSLNICACLFPPPTYFLYHLSF